ncbi:MAG: hypothetical protein K8I00_03540 [Candidatus Omnitrophica bacterium]|nr:hypothetical protein [Candidatus Omnitrophota bacterium]
MLRRRFFEMRQESAQSLAEYLMVMGGIIAILFVFTLPGGKFMTSVNQASEITISMMNATATEIFDDLGTVN